jgi:hypothetical protein
MTCKHASIRQRPASHRSLELRRAALREIVEMYWRFTQDLEDDAIAALAGFLVREMIAQLRKPRRGRRKRRAIIYKANGEIYRTVDLDEPAGDE